MIINPYFCKLYGKETIFNMYWSFSYSITDLSINQECINKLCVLYNGLFYVIFATVPLVFFLFLGLGLDYGLRL